MARWRCIAVRGSRLEIFPGEFRGHHGAERFRQVHHDDTIGCLMSQQRPLLPRHVDVGELSGDETRRPGIPNSVSYFKDSTADPHLSAGECGTATAVLRPPMPLASYRTSLAALETSGWRSRRYYPNQLLAGSNSGCYRRALVNQPRVLLAERNLRQSRHPH